ncbi:hypothetical protein COO60DRAFT_1581084 [Scenedesmus sp. NREL 46B-D3]|nr:hypothetical protein COO60DRAFT_1581084 [Scenedesmus sp. NREL 46B-D3]
MHRRKGQSEAASSMLPFLWLFCWQWQCSQSPSTKGMPVSKTQAQTQQRVARLRAAACHRSSRRAAAAGCWFG